MQVPHPLPPETRQPPKFEYPDDAETALRGPTPGRLHHHRINGALIACYHTCRHRWYIWIPLWLLGDFVIDVARFPLEHTLWEWLQ